MFFYLCAMSVRIPPITLTFAAGATVPAPSRLEATLQGLTGLELDFVAARIDKQTFEKAAEASPLDLNWGLGDEDYFDRIAINHQDFASTIRLSLTPAYRSVRLDVPVFRDYLWWMTLKALTEHGAVLPGQAMELPGWTRFEWHDEEMPRAVKMLRELHEQKFQMVAKIMEDPDFKQWPEEEVDRRMNEGEDELDRAFREKYGDW